MHKAPLTATVQAVAVPLPVWQHVKQRPRVRVEPQVDGMEQP
jgi:hypothetical protein